VGAVTLAVHPGALGDVLLAIPALRALRAQGDPLVLAAQPRLGALLEALDAWRARLEGQGFAPVRERWRALAETLGQTVSIDGVQGVAVDVDEDGALLVDADGRRRRVVAGEVA
jgi:biotin-(acetyl-CoA carboxylase) ligase